MAKVPMIADGGELTMLRRLASDVYGKERVDWPEQMPDEVKPKIDEGFEFGYLYKLDENVGRMGRRFVRADVSILAADFEDGKSTPIPDSGFSDFEAVLDEASQRVAGEALFQKEITRAGLGPLVPFRDFTVGDIWPMVWCNILELDLPVSRIEAVSEVGAVADWRVVMGSELLSDLAAQQRQNDSAARAVEQARRQDRAEARRQAEEARKTAERTARTAVETQRRYIDGDFRSQVNSYALGKASDAESNAKAAAEQAKRDAISYAKRDLWLYGEPGYAVKQQFDSYQSDLMLLSLKMGGSPNVQNAFANELWRQDSLIREMQSKGISVDRQANAFAQYNEINTALWQNQKSLDDAQNYRSPVFGTFESSGGRIYDFGFNDVILEVGVSGRSIGLRGYRSSVSRVYGWSYKISMVVQCRSSGGEFYSVFKTYFIGSENSSVTTAPFDDPVVGGFVLIGRR